MTVLADDHGVEWWCLFGMSWGSKLLAIFNAQKQQLATSLAFEKGLHTVKPRNEEPTFSTNSLIFSGWGSCHKGTTDNYGKENNGKQICGGLSGFPFVEDESQCKIIKMKQFAYVLKFTIWKFHVLSNIMFHLIRTWKEIVLFFVLVFGCIFTKSQPAGSCFPIFLFVVYYCIIS